MVKNYLKKHCGPAFLLKKGVYLLSVHDDLGGSDANLVLWHIDKVLVFVSNQLRFFFPCRLFYPLRTHRPLPALVICVPRDIVKASTIKSSRIRGIFNISTLDISIKQIFQNGQGRNLLRSPRN